MKVHALFDPATYTLTYVVYDEATRDAVVIDPVLDYDAGAAATSTTSLDALGAFVAQHGLRVHFALETHAHADHVSGGAVLRKRLGAQVVVGARITEVQRTFRGVFDLGDAFAIDGSQFDRLVTEESASRPARSPSASWRPPATRRRVCRSSSATRSSPATRCS